MIPPASFFASEPMSVSTLNTLADDLLRSGMGTVYVEGEVSNLRRYGSGHRYFSLKDDQSTLACTLFRGNAQNAAHFAEGDLVRVHGRVGIYTARGQYQLIVEHLMQAGAGQWLAAFEALKKKLLAEGLFAPERKRALPRFVRRLGVITSAQGDVRHDIARTLARRFPLLLPFRLYPVSVQGSEAAAQIVNALAQAVQEQVVDVLLLARGGGSLEDFQAFNTEEVARAIARSPIPVVTGIGHETDTTIADYVADLRASTPTAAAEAISPDGETLHQQLQLTEQRLQGILRAAITTREQQLRSFRHRLAVQDPRRVLEQNALRVDDWLERLHRVMQRRRDKEYSLLEQWQQRLHQQSPAKRMDHWIDSLRKIQYRLALQSPERRRVLCQDAVRQLENRLLQQDPTRRFPEKQQQLIMLLGRLQQNLQHRRQQAFTRLGHLQNRLQTLSQESVLRRGFAILRTETGEIVRDAEQVEPGQNLRATVGLGELRLTVISRSSTKPSTPEQ